MYKSALKINPNNPTLINNLAKAYFDTNNIELAKNYCLKALKLNKNDGNIQKILSLIYFRQQNYKLGWSYFDGRLDLSDFVKTNSSIYNIRKILFQKETLDKNLNLLVIREQGIGDEILYGTIYNDLLMSHENVTIECDKRLKNIFCNSFPKFKNSFVEFGKISLNKDLLNNFDAAIYAGSLGKFFRNDIKNFNNGNYLIPENILIQKSDIELKKLSKKFNIGISWKSFKNRYANEKSLSLKDLNNIFSSEDCNFINLQYGNVQNEISKYNSEYNKNIVTLKYLDIFNDFDNLASVLKSLDLFITVSNSTAHLAGSIGVKNSINKTRKSCLVPLLESKRK